MLIRRIFTSRLTYLSVSLALFMACMPMISWGTYHGDHLIWITGFLMLICGALIPPVQRLVFGPPKK